MANGFKFLGFEPDHDVINRCHELFWKMVSRSPAAAMNTAVISKSNQGYAGHIRISSITEDFMADAKGLDPIQVLEDLYRQIQKQITVWNDQRFSSAQTL